jgi:hypothetical protein
MTLFVGCGNKSGQTINEPEITGDYLAGEYSQQLLTDGADAVVGFVTIEKQDDNTYHLTLEEQEVVASDSYDDGYYCADTNICKEADVTSDERIATYEDGSYQVGTIEDLMKETSENSEALYTVYFMGDSAELIVRTLPEDLLYLSN